MRIRIDHATTYAYDRAARFIVQTLRMTPRSSEAQQVRHWRIETDVDARIRKSEDAFGNVVHTLYTEQPTQSLTVRVSGEVVTNETAGVVPPGEETLSPLVFLRDTPLTRRDKLISVFASEFSAHPPLDRMHRLMAAINGSVAFEVGVTTPTNTAAEVLALGRGVCQDHAHVFIACARQMGVPARYVSGYSVACNLGDMPPTPHGWAEAFVPGLGWVAFDPCTGLCADEAYARVAVALDSAGAAPVAGSRLGEGDEELDVDLHVGRANGQD